MGPLDIHYLSISRYSSSNLYQVSKSFTLVSIQNSGGCNVTIRPCGVGADAPEEPSTDINYLHLRPSTATNHDRAEKKSVQRLDPVYLNILSHDVRESIVNAVWNQSLREVFQYPDFVLAPEYYTPRNRLGLISSSVVKPIIPLIHWYRCLRIKEERDQSHPRISSMRLRKYHGTSQTCIG